MCGHLLWAWLGPLAVRPLDDHLGLEEARLQEHTLHKAGEGAKDGMQGASMRGACRGQEGEGEGAGR